MGHYLLELELKMDGMSIVQEFINVPSDLILMNHEVLLIE